jgi:hypothetical protein
MAGSGVGVGIHRPLPVALATRRVDSRPSVDRGARSIRMNPNFGLFCPMPVLLAILLPEGIVTGVLRPPFPLGDWESENRELATRPQAGAINSTC